MSTKVKNPFLTLVQGVAFGTVLSYERRQSCKFRFETNGKMGVGHTFLHQSNMAAGIVGCWVGGVKTQNDENMARLQPGKQYTCRLYNFFNSTHNQLHYLNECFKIIAVCECG